MKDSKPGQESIRSRIIALLQILSSEALQLEYEKNAPNIDITAEIVCMWFDDHYHPGSQRWADQFSDNELESLAEFHRYFDTRIQALPESKGTVLTWSNDSAWQGIMAKALQTLGDLSCP